MISSFGRLSRVLAVIALASTAGSALAQKAPPAFKKAPADCFKYPLSLPANMLRTIADSCETQFNTARKLPDELAYAGLHSATARNQLQEYAKATPVLERVVAEPRTTPAAKSDARYQLALAYVGQGGQAQGADRSALLSKGITELDAFMNSGVQRGTPLYNAAVFQRSTAYLSRGSGTLDFSNAIDGFASLAGGGPGIDANLQAQARQQLVTTAVAAGASELKPGSNDSAAAQRAAAIYEKALPYDQRNLDLSIGLGAARLVIADTAAQADKNGWYERARAAYTTALQANPGGAQAATVNLGLARSSRALGQLREAIGYYKSATSYAPSDIAAVTALADTQVQFARGLPEGGDKVAAYRDAEATYQNLLRQPITPAAKATALMMLADVQGQQPGRQEDVRQTLMQAISADPGSTRAPLQVGTIMYNQGRYADAASYFQQVINLTGGATGAPAPGDLDAKAEAFYHLSLISSQRGAGAGAPTLSAAVTNADAAVRLGASRSPYREQACVARVLRGGASVTAADAQTACSGNDQADGMLLLGMFHLRKARFVGATSRPASLELAQVWFDAGLREVNRSATPPVSKIKWPGATASPVLKDMLQYGKAKVVSCSGLSTDVSLSADQIRRAEEFFRLFGVDDCSSAQ